MEALRLHVLLVNEDPSLLARMSEIIGQQGFTYQIAHNREEALKFLMHDNFHVMVTDMTMPDDDGIYLCKKWGQRLPIVMLQGSQDDKLREGLSSFSCCFLDKGEINARLVKATWTAFNRFKIDQQIERDLVAA